MAYIIATFKSGGTYEGHASNKSFSTNEQNSLNDIDHLILFMHDM